MKLLTSPGKPSMVETGEVVSEFETCGCIRNQRARQLTHLVLLIVNIAPCSGIVFVGVWGGHIGWVSRTGADEDTNTSAGLQRAVCMVVSDELNDCSLSDCSKVGAAPARTKGTPDRNKVTSWLKSCACGCYVMLCPHGLCPHGHSVLLVMAFPRLTDPLQVSIYMDSSLNFTVV